MWTFRRIGASFAVLAALGCPVFGQARTSSTTSGSGDPGQAIQVIFLSGVVALDDGSPLPGPVIIERLCGGPARPEGHTDAKGNFGIRLGENRDSFADASSRATTTPLPGRSVSATSNIGGGGGASNSVGGVGGSGVRENNLWSCSIRAQLTGYRSDTIALAGRRGMDNPNVGTIILHRLSNIHGFTTSATTLEAPKDAQKLYQKGVEAAKKGNPDEAQKSFQKAVEMYPQYAVAWLDLGRILEFRDHLADAQKAYQRALDADPKYVTPYERLYLLAARANKWQEVADLSDKLYHLNPYDFPGAYYYNALANMQLDKLDAAEKSAREGLKLDTEGKNPRLNYVLGVTLGMKRDFRGAAEYLRVYVKAAPDAKDIDTARQQLAQAEKLVQDGAK
jgi:tetratricopeptide (TPR) repeat protein